MNKKILITVIFFSLIGIFAGPSFVSALTVYTYDNFSNLKTDETKTIKVFINTEGKEINVMEGKLKITGPAKISSIDTLGSVFSLWPEKPELSTNQEINFTGGIEGGVYGKDLRLLDFTITRTDKGGITIEPVGVIAYLNDGKGTKLENSNSNILINTNNTNDLIAKILSIILIIVVLFTLINIFRKIFIRKNK